MPPASGRGTAVVTGGGRGIGAACCRRLAHDGYAVVVNYRTRAAPAEQLVAEITAAGGRALAVGADVGTEAGVAALFAAVDAAGLPPLTALVNNAGVLGPLGNDLDATSAEALSDVFNVNVLGPLLCCREVLRSPCHENPPKVSRLWPALRSSFQVTLVANPQHLLQLLNAALQPSAALHSPPQPSTALHNPYIALHSSLKPPQPSTALNRLHSRPHPISLCPISPSKALCNPPPPNAIHNPPQPFTTLYSPHARQKIQ